MKIEFFFDCSSPYTYLAFENIQPLAKEFEAEIVWRPILVGGVFNQVNQSVGWLKNPDRSQRKIDYMLKDFADRARVAGVKLHFPPTGHPVNSVKVMRACLVLEPEGKLIPFAREAFKAYFGDDRPLNEDAVVIDLCKAVGVDPDWLMARISEQEVKDALRANVDELIARGGYGSPTYFLDRDDMYFGDDRLHLLRHAMERARETSAT